MSKKLCRTCSGEGHIKNPKYGDLFICFGVPDDYVITCSECDGTGKRGRHEKAGSNEISGGDQSSSD